MNQEKDELAAATQLRAVLGESSATKYFGWVRVVQILFRHLEWEQINEAVKAHRPDHESVLGAINNLRQIESLTTSANKRSDYGKLFEEYFTLTRDIEHGWSPAREQNMRVMVEYVMQQKIQVSDKVSAMLREDYPTLWRQ